MKKNLLITCVMLLFAVVSMAQNKITVSGVVSDKTGMTVIGATVSVKGAPQQGVVTGLDGDYKITNVPSNAVLLYSYIGMKDQEIAVLRRKLLLFQPTDGPARCDHLYVRIIQRKLNVLMSVLTIS